MFRKQGKTAIQPGLERWSAYKTIWARHWTDFQKIYPFRFQNIYGPLTDEKKDQVKKLIWYRTQSPFTFRLKQKSPVKANNQDRASYLINLLTVLYKRPYSQ